jgi:rare lipoprotein A
MNGLSRSALFGTLLLAACGQTPRPETRAGKVPTTTSPSRPQAPRGPVADTPVKIGKPYQVAGQYYYPSDNAVYDEVGYASWYGDAFHGGATANGEIYDMNMVGAAHKTLPLPSYAEVTALDTGKTVLVRINDRGPFVTNRIIDLSRQAAEELGITRKGVARVRVKRVFPSDEDRLALRSGKRAGERPEASRTTLAALDQRFQRWQAVQAAPLTPVVTVAQPATALTSSALGDSIGGWFVQFAALGDRARADTLALSIGGDIEIAGNIYRVRTGPYFDEKIAMAALARAQGDGYQDARLIRPYAGNRPAGSK